jgi:hypothetical protein
MKDKRTLIIVTAALIISLITAIYVSYQRIRIEKMDNVVELTADYSDIERLSKYEGLRMADVFKKLKAAGITSVALTEDISGNVDVNFIAGVDPKKLNLYMPARGLSGEKIRLIESSGLRVIPRIRNVFSQKKEIINRKIQEISKYGAVIFAEEEVLGYPNYLKETARAIKSNNIKYGFIEFGKQLGDIELASYAGGSMIKVHSIPPDEMEKLTKKEIIKRFARAARERSIRMLYVHSLSYPDNGKGLLETNIGFIGCIKSELESNNLIIGQASSPKKISVNRVEKSFISFGISGGTILLASCFIPVDLVVTLIILIMFTIIPSKLLALISAVVFPAYAVISQFPVRRESLKYGLISSSVSITMYIAGSTAYGAILISALLSEKLHMLGVEGFSGVKIAFVLPILIVASYFFLRSEDGRLELKGSLKKLNELLSINVTIFHIGLLFIISVAGALFILRSGNFGIPVPGIEKFARGLLENVLSVRPRTKELLLGYPALILASIYYLKGGNKWLWLWLSLGVLAPISLINSFCHIHTPLAITLVRSCIGLVLGITLGLILYLCYVLIMRINKFINE